MAREADGAAGPQMDRLFELLSRLEDVPSLTAPDWAAVLNLAEMHAVAPLLAQRVATGAVAPEEVASELRASQEQTSRRNARRIHDFAVVVTALQTRGVPVLALKGMHLVPLVYRSLAARAMIDLDLMVPVHSLAEAGEVMRALGYEPLAPYRVSDGPLPFAAHHLPSFVKQGASTVEIHWHVTAPPSPLSMPTELWSRAVPARIGGVDVHVLATEDLLLHLALHGMYNSRCTISVRACCDMAEVIRTEAVHWDVVVDRAIRWNLAGGTYLALRLVRDRLGAVIPGHVLNALEPRDFDPRLLQIALRGEVDPRRADRLRHAAGPLAKLRTIAETLFLRPDEIADRYAVPRSSPFVSTLYLRRAAAMLTGWRDVVAAHRGDGRAGADSAALDAFLRRPR